MSESLLLLRDLLEDRLLLDQGPTFKGHLSCRPSERDRILEAAKRSTQHTVRAD